ncbi:MAG: sigma-70 family RNA polymerase sigma factor [Clostridia bacterium]|nr:sigma-70 family RNA polymerase sigma factor [Clostridia bacterium]
MNDNIFLLAKNGNKDAIELVISTVKPFIFKQCGKMKLHGYDFDDLCQISYESVVKNIPKINKDHLDTAPSFLMKCIHNTLKYEARRALSKPEAASIEAEDKDGIRYSEKLVSEDDTERIVFRDYQSSVVKEAYASLNLEEKTILSFFITDPYGGLKRYSELYNMDYRKSRYLKDKTLKKMKTFLESSNDDDFDL